MINPQGTTSTGEAVLKTSRLQTTVERWRPREVFPGFSSIHLSDGGGVGLQ